MTLFLYTFFFLSRDLGQAGGSAEGLQQNGSTGKQIALEAKPVSRPPDIRKNLDIRISAEYPERLCTFIRYANLINIPF